MLRRQKSSVATGQLYDEDSFHVEATSSYSRANRSNAASVKSDSDSRRKDDFIKRHGDGGRMNSLYNRGGKPKEIKNLTSRATSSTGEVSSKFPFLDKRI